MGAIVALDGVTATFDGELWISRDEVFAAFLNATKPEQGGSDPHYSRTVAEAAVAAIRGVTIVHIDDPPWSPPGTVF